MRRYWLVAAVFLAACSGGGSDARPVAPSPTTSADDPATAPADPSPTSMPTTTSAESEALPPGGGPPPFATVPEPTHPLDGLSVGEVEAFRGAIENDDRFDIFATRFPYIGLTPPDKQAVADFVDGSPLARTITAVVIQGDEVFDVIVDPATATVVSSTLDPEANPAFINQEFSAAINAAIQDPQMIAGFATRGITPDKVVCLAFSPGQPRNAGEVGVRLLRVSCFAAGEATDAFWSRPIEGLVATYDLDNDVILSVLDDEAERATPIPPALATTVPRPPRTVPESTTVTSAAIEAEGSSVAWDQWSFRWHIDRRVGLVVNDVRFHRLGGTDGARPDGVLYEASMSDMFVPYQDPDPAWAFRTFLDAGEFGMGTTLSPLIRGVDCPIEANYLAAVVADELANGNIIDGAACVFERAPTTPSWRHAADGDAGSELVLRAISTVGNYDYIIDVVFSTDGSIRFDVAAAGIVLQKATAATTDAEHEATGEHVHGELVAPNLVGVDHDHYLNFRLDLDVLGSANRLNVQHLVREDLAPPGAEPVGRNSIWRIDPRVQAVEGPSFEFGSASPDTVRWLFEGADDGTGNRPAYLLDPMDSMASPIAAVTDPGITRAGWIGAPLWVTPYDPTELYAGGRQLPDGTSVDGLPAWTQTGAPIEDTDIVAWYTVGFHHVVRSEDLPNMPVHRASFRLIPQNILTPEENPFFTPAL